MAIRSTITAIVVLVLAFSSNFELSVCKMVKGKVSCIDCDSDYNFSGIKIIMKCDGGGKEAPTTTTTAADGRFKAELPGGEEHSRNCLARILGGPDQLYAQRHNMVSQIVLSKNEPHTLTTSKPLTFSLSRPKLTGEYSVENFFGSWKTATGLPPASDFFSFFPIIGIP